MSAPDSELEDDEEEILVYVEFDNFANNDVFSSENLKLDMLGLDSDHPVMQINGKFFEGTYENAPGTYLFFEKDNNPDFDDPIFDKIPSLKYFNKTRKLLRMQRAFLVPRYEVTGDSKHSKCIPNEDTLKEAGVPPPHLKEALSFWQKSRNSRMDALNKYLKKQEFRKELRMRGFEPESESDEENPFAMYKYTGDDLDDDRFIETRESNVEHSVQQKESPNKNTPQIEEPASKSSSGTPKKLTVIDPGPSTSKSSKPWIGDDEEKNDDGGGGSKDDDSDWVPFSKKVKSIGRVTRTRVTKPKVVKKISKKKIAAIQMNRSEESATLDQSFGISSVTCNETEQQSSTKKNNEAVESAQLNGSDGIGEAEQKKTKAKPKTSVAGGEMEVGDIAAEESDKLLSMELKLDDEKKKKKQEKRKAKMKEIREKMEALKNQDSSQSNS